MACKMKRTMTRAEQAKLKKENVERVKGMKEAREEYGKRGVEKEVSKEKKKEGVRCYRKAERGNMCPERNKKIPKWHRTLDSVTTLAKGCERNHPKYQRGLPVPDHSHNGHTRGRRGLLGRLARAGELMPFICKACYYHAKGYSVSEMHSRGYLTTFRD